MPNFNFYFVILYILQFHIPTNVPPLHREPFCMYFASLFQGRGMLLVVSGAGGCCLLFLGRGDVACCFRRGMLLGGMLLFFRFQGRGDVACCFSGGGMLLVVSGEGDWDVACCFRGGGGGGMLLVVSVMGGCCSNTVQSVS